MASVRKVHAVIGIIVGAAAIVAFGVQGAIRGVQAQEQLSHATPKVAFDSLAARVAQHDTLFRDIRGDLRAIRNDVYGIKCQLARYPSPFCDSVPRVMQAGLPRSRP
jgi:hypothetical protein